MIISFICWLIGKSFVSDDEIFGFIMIISGLTEWVLYFCLIGSHFGWAQ